MKRIVDVSHWEISCNYSLLKTYAEGIIAKASQGTFKDISFDGFITGAVQAEFPHGSYHYYDNYYPPKKQAEYYVKTIENRIGVLNTWLDLEDGRMGDYGTWDDWYQFLDRFQTLLPNVKIGIYTRASYFDAKVPASKREYFGQFPLWVAHYGVAVPTLPKAWDNWKIWQFTDHAEAIGFGSKEVDLNYYKDEKRTMTAIIGGAKAEYEEQ